MPDVMASMGQNMSHPQNFRKHSDKVSLSRVQTTTVRGLQYMKRLETKRVDKYYTKGKAIRTEIFQFPCSILIIR